MGQFKSTYTSPHSTSISVRAHAASAATKPSPAAPQVERTDLAQASVNLAQASKTTPRGRGTGRRFTKATAAGAAVARAQRLAPEQRQEIARRAASARWGGKKAAGS